MVAKVRMFSLFCVSVTVKLNNLEQKKQVKDESKNVKTSIRSGKIRHQVPKELYAEIS